jgi:hypothetical protein
VKNSQQFNDLNRDFIAPGYQSCVVLISLHQHKNTDVFVCFK